MQEACLPKRTVLRIRALRMGSSSHMAIEQTTVLVLNLSKHIE